MGDVCEDDKDGDGVLDAEDDCPYNGQIHKTDFRDFQIIDVTPNLPGEVKAAWYILNEVLTFRNFYCSPHLSFSLMTFF